MPRCAQKENSRCIMWGNKILETELYWSHPGMTTFLEDATTSELVKRGYEVINKHYL